MKLLDDLSELKKLVATSGKYVGSTKTKQKLMDFYRNNWLPISEDFENKFGSEKCSKIENNIKKIYDLAKTKRPSKQELLSLLSENLQVVDEIELEMIRKHGSIIEVDAKEEIKKSLDTHGFSNTVGYIKRAENYFSLGNSKDSCIQSRLAIEEFFRDLREKKVGSPINRGTLGNHVDHLEKRLGIIRHSERCFIQYGFYSFLSEKGNHATTDIPTSEDAKLSIYVLYSLLEYCLEKYV